jgi:hypothetical protein
MPDDCPDLTGREAATVWGGGRAVHMIKLTATQEICAGLVGDDAP